LFPQKKNLIFKINSIETLLFPDLQLPEKMSKRQKLSFLQFEGLPDEILLKIVSLLDINGVLQCGQVSTRLRAISNDQSLWLKLNLTGRKVPYGLIEKAIQNGCEYLHLDLSCVHGGTKSEEPWKLKYLEISQSGHRLAQKMPEGILENCQYLQKLLLNNLILNTHDIEQICQNGETLQILSLERCDIYYPQRTELIPKLISKCPLLTELNMNMSNRTHINGDKFLLDQQLCALVDNLTPNILKLQFGSQIFLQDHHVDALVQRCIKITELNLYDTSITNDSVSIVRNLKFLEKLNVGRNNISFPTLLELKSIPTLKILNCSSHYDPDFEIIENLKLQLPHITIN
jgi:hypothetical protein